MGIANPKQKVQDWLTQQWVILLGQSIDRDKDEWLLGPFGNTNGIGIKFIHELAQREELVIDNSQPNKGLIQSIEQLKLSEADLGILSTGVIDFYENTSNYELELKIKWNPFLKVFGRLLKWLFSNRIQQLNIPTNTLRNSDAITSEIIQLKKSETNEIKRTVWLRSFKETGQVVYSGVYGTCVIPSGKTCIKAVFPLPNGNATVILEPIVGKQGELILQSSGRKFGDCGFYFLLNDSKGKLWAKYIRSFEDSLIAQSAQSDSIWVQQKLSLWKQHVVSFEYDIRRRVRQK